MITPSEQNFVKAILCDAIILYYILIQKKSPFWLYFLKLYYQKGLFLKWIDVIKLRPNCGEAFISWGFGGAVIEKVGKRKKVIFLLAFVLLWNGCGVKSAESESAHRPPETWREDEGIIVVPWDENICLDMDGDGKEETLSIHLDIGAERSDDDSAHALPVVTVDGRVFNEDVFYSLCSSEGWEIMGDGWSIVDLDISDSYLEIALSYYADRYYRTCVLRYEQGELAFTGSIATSPLKADEIPGDGNVCAAVVCHAVEYESSGKMTWHLDDCEDFHAKLVCGQDYYELQEYDKNSIPCLKKLVRDTNFYQSMGGENGKTIMLPEGTEIWFVRYYPKERWMELAYDEDGIYKDGEKHAWFQIVYEVDEKPENGQGLIRLPDGEINPHDCFEGLIWGG